jgi:hypothetical protein
MGYWQIETSLSAAQLNAAQGVTSAQAQAMRLGSMFGWDRALANPANHEGGESAHAGGTENL